MPYLITLEQAPNRPILTRWLWVSTGFQNKQPGCTSHFMRSTGSEWARYSKLIGKPAIVLPHNRCPMEVQVAKEDLLPIYPREGQEESHVVTRTSSSDNLFGKAMSMFWKWRARRRAAFAAANRAREKKGEPITIVVENPKDMEGLEGVDTSLRVVAWWMKPESFLTDNEDENYKTGSSSRVPRHGSQAPAAGPKASNLLGILPHADSQVPRVGSQAPITDSKRRKEVSP